MRFKAFQDNFFQTIHEFEIWPLIITNSRNEIRIFPTISSYKAVNPALSDIQFNQMD